MHSLGSISFREEYISVFSTNMIKAKLYMNVHWMVLYKIYVFCSDMKFKMAATAGLSLTLNPMGKNVSKRFFSETTWIIETKLLRNDHWKVLKLSSAVAAILNFISEQKT
jgi:phage-related protein